ncbi:hypothetical protein [Flavobacterium sp.]|uniref:hypothetical protein n=1 Tax=Flavobacterium sp. TaxID=239 RepID=UPI004048E398
MIPLLLLCFSCTQPKETTTLKIEIDTVIKESDSIHVFYTKNSTLEFNENSSFWEKVNGSDKNQKIILQFPKDTFPKQIRIDFGNNIKQQEIVLNKINFQFKNKSFSLLGKEIYYYFRIDESVTELNKGLGVLKRRNSLQTRGPSLYPKGDNLFNKLNKFQND